MEESLSAAVPGQLPFQYISLETSVPWILYWFLQSRDLLSGQNAEAIEDDTVAIIDLARDTLASVYDAERSGAFCGSECMSESGPDQADQPASIHFSYPHLLTTYAAMSSLKILDETALNEQFIKREKLSRWLQSLQCEDGSFRVHEEDGESDLRGCYAAVATAKLAGLLDNEDGVREMFHRTIQFILSCQTYEGGLGGSPCSEAHGGYTFCGIASLKILGQVSLLNLPLLAEWLAQRQQCIAIQSDHDAEEDEISDTGTGLDVMMCGGFNGRTNKLVDGCYSYWVGASMRIVEEALSKDASGTARAKETLSTANMLLLRNYILNACQNDEIKRGKMQGGLRDKPGK